MARTAPHNPLLLPAWALALCLSAWPVHAQDSGPASGPAASAAAAPSAASQDSTEKGAKAPDTAAQGAGAHSPGAQKPAAAPGALPEPGVLEIAAPENADGDLTIEVDKKQSSNENKSLPLALFFSAALPGAGEYYLQDKSRAKVFLLVETGFWASLYVAYLAKQSYFQSARNYATEFAGINASRKSEAFLETMANFRAYQEKQHRQDSYELAQILAGKREQDYDIPPAPENYWDFGSSNTPANTENWKTFQSTLRYYRASKVAMSFAIGALALNRLASLVNTLNVYKRTSAKRYGVNVTPDLGTDYAGAQLTLRF